MWTSMWNNWNSHILLLVIQNSTDMLEKRMAGSYKVKHILYNSAIPILDILEKFYKKPYLYTKTCI